MHMLKLVRIFIKQIFDAFYFMQLFCICLWDEAISRIKLELCLHIINMLYLAWKELKLLKSFMLYKIPAGKSSVMTCNDFICVSSAFRTSKS